MNIDKLIQDAVQCNELDAHFPFIRSLLGHAIQMSPSENSKSQIGGKPLVSEDFDWPEHTRGLHTAIAQIDCSELPSNSRLPSSGLLTFFAAHDPDGDSWCWEKEFMKICYFPEPSELQHLPGQYPEFARLAVDFHLKYSFPFNPYLRNDWPWEIDDHDAFEYGVSEDLGDAVVNESGDFLLGHAPGSRIAGNPSPGDDWELLLLLRSDDDLEMIWGDDSALMVFIESEALSRLDFENPSCVIG